MSSATYAAIFTVSLSSSLAHVSISAALCSQKAAVSWELPPFTAGDSPGAVSALLTSGQVVVPNLKHLSLSPPACPQHTTSGYVGAQLHLLERERERARC